MFDIMNSSAAVRTKCELRKAFLGLRKIFFGLEEIPQFEEAILESVFTGTI